MARLSTWIRFATWPLLALAALEICARVDDSVTYGASPWQNYNHNSLWVHDQLGQRGRPHGQYLKWKLNGGGFRSPEPDPALLHVGVTGASETFGVFEREGQEWPRHLERELNAPGGGVRIAVDNLAWPGLLVSTTRRHLPAMLAYTKPRVMVIYSSPTAYLFRDVAPEEQKTVHLPAADGVQLRIQARVETVIKRVMPERMQNWLRIRQVAKAEAAQKEVFDRVPERIITLYADDLRGIIDDLRAAGVEPVLVTHATLFGKRVEDDVRDWLTVWRRGFPMLREDGFLDMENRANEAMRRVAAERGVALADVAARMPAGRQYFADFVHFTDRGAAEMARIVAERVACLRGGTAACLAQPAPGKGE